MADMTLSAIMKLDSAGFSNPLAGIRRGVGSTIATLAGLAGVGLGVAGAIAGLKNALNLGGKLSDLSAMTGVAVGKLMVLRQVMEDTGVSAEKAQLSINTMQRNLSSLTGSSAGGKVIEQMGLDLQALMKLAPEDQFETIGKAIGGLTDPAQQTAVAMAIFGKSGAELKTLFASPEAFDITRKSLGALPALMERNANLFDSISDAMRRMKMKSVGLFAGIAEGVAPALSGVLAQLDSIDLTRIGQSIGNAIAMLIEAFQGGELSDIISLSLKIGFGKGVNFLASIIGSAQFWGGVAQMVLGAFVGIGGALLKVFTTPLLYLQAGMDTVVDKLFAALAKVPGVNKAMGLENYGPAKSFSQHLQDREKTGSFLGNAAGAALKESEGLMAAGMAGIKAALENTTIVFPVDKLEQQLETVANGLQSRVDVKLAAAQAAAEKKKGEAGLLPEIAAPTKDGAMEIATDRLARIGGLIGGGGPALDHSKRTASATERTAKTIDRLYQFISSRGVTENAAAWA